MSRQRRSQGEIDHGCQQYSREVEATLNAIVEADSEPVKIYRASDSFRENQRSIVTSIPPLRR